MSDMEVAADNTAADAAAIASTQTAANQPANTMETLTQSMSAAYDKINPPREATGQYAAKEKTETDGALASDAKESTDQPKTQTQEPAKPAIPPPVSWSAEMKAKWATLPPAVQEYAAQRDSEAHKRISELGQVAKANEPTHGVLEQYRDVLNLNGAQPHENLSRALNAARWFTQNPRAATLALVKDFAPDLLNGSGETSEGDKSEYVRSLETRLERAERLATDAAAKITARERSEEEQSNAAISKQINDFAEGKPHFEAVRKHMAALLQTGAAETLESAYEQATYAVPEIRQRILEDQRKADEEKRTEEAKKKADEAKKLASINVKSGRGANPAKKGNWEATLREVGERVAG